MLHILCDRAGLPLRTSAASVDYRSVLRTWLIALSQSRDFNSIGGVTAVVRAFVEPAILATKRQSSVIALLDVLSELVAVRGA